MFRHKSVIVSFTFLLHMLRISSCFFLFRALLTFSFSPSQHVSGSAYKIISERAYHHGTMLISTRLDHLGNMLRPEEVLLLFIRKTDFLSFPAYRIFDPLGLNYTRITLDCSSLMTGKENPLNFSFWKSVY